MKLGQFASLVTVCVLVGGGARADEWFQWRGPNRDGISQEKNLLKKWPSQGPKLVWQIHGVGSGYSTPIAVGNRLYVMGNDGMNSESVLAFDLASGKPIWKTKIGKVGNPDQQPNYPGSRSTPTVNGKFVYALGSDGDLACLESATGKPVWKHNLRTAFGGKPGVWAYSESPLVDGDRVVVTPGGEQATMVALDKRTGNTLWKSVAPEKDTACYSSPIVMEIGGVRQYVQYLTKGLAGVDARTGKFLWRFDKTIDTRFSMHASTPIAQGASVYSAAAVNGGLARITKENGGYTTTSVYVERKVPNYLGGAIKVGDYLYGTNNSVLMCIEFATGKVKWEDRSIGASSLCYADGRLYLHSENGEMALVEATPAAYHELGRFTPPNQPERGQSKAWAYPIIAKGNLYIRDLDTIWCYDIGGTGGSR
jgi:outer membrane protein assembly factor BamB